MSAAQAIGSISVLAGVPPLPDRTLRKTLHLMFWTDEALGQLLRILVIDWAVAAMKVRAKAKMRSKKKPSYSGKLQP